MDKNELRLYIAKTEKMFDKRRNKRAIYTILGYAVFFLLVAYCSNGFSLLDLWGTIRAVVSCVVLSAIHVFINAAVLGHLFIENEAEKRVIEDLKKQLNNADEESRM